MNQLSEEQKEQLLEAIVETPAGERIRMACGAADLRSVITDVFSTMPYTINEVDAQRLADYHKIGSMPAIVKSTDYGADTLAECVEKAVDRWYHRGRRDAATAMRDKCVGAIKLLWTTDRGNDYNGALNDALRAIEFLTLDQVEPEKQK